MLGSILEDNLPMGTIIENRQTDESVAVDMFVLGCLSNKDDLRGLNRLHLITGIHIVRKSVVAV